MHAHFLRLVEQSPINSSAAFLQALTTCCADATQSEYILISHSIITELISSFNAGSDAFAKYLRLQFVVSDLFFVSPPYGHLTLERTKTYLFSEFISKWE